MFSFLRPRVISSIPMYYPRSIIISPVFPRFFSDAAGGSSSRLSGQVKWFDSGKGFGFITRETGEDIFVHFTAIRGSGYRSLEEGQKVEFIVGQGAKGPAAQDVSIVAGQRGPVGGQGGGARRPSGLGNNNNETA